MHALLIRLIYILCLQLKIQNFNVKPLLFSSLNGSRANPPEGHHDSIMLDGSQAECAWPCM